MSYSEVFTTTDEYQYLTCPASSKVTLQVSNAAVSVGFGINPKGVQGAGQYPTNDETYLPSSAGLGRTCDEIRVKNYSPGVSATVYVTAL